MPSSPFSCGPWDTRVALGLFKELVASLLTADSYALSFSQGSPACGSLFGGFRNGWSVIIFSHFMETQQIYE